MAGKPRKRYTVSALKKRGGKIHEKNHIRFFIGGFISYCGSNNHCYGYGVSNVRTGAGKHKS